MRKEYLDRIVSATLEHCSPLRIILFGSRAWGKSGPDSDLDILIIVSPSSKRPSEIAAAISASVPHPVSLDILVKTSDRVAKALKEGDTFLQEVMERGRVLYEAKHQEVAGKG